MFEPTTWQNKTFITFDVDWASDEVLEYVIEILKKYDAKGTFFATHKTKVLDSSNSSNYEVGMHPNFNFLLNGDFRYGANYKEVISFYKRMYPDSVSVRSHSLTQSSLITEEFFKQGFKFESNHLSPHVSVVELRPYSILGDDIVKVPFLWIDDVHFYCQKPWSWDLIMQSKGLRVLDFHPIHVFLNTEKIERYYDAKPFLNDFEELKKHINTGSYGTRDFLIDLLKKINN